MGIGKGAWRDHLMEAQGLENTASAFAAYEAVRHRLPEARHNGPGVRAGSLADIADQFDVYLLDAFGVLNIGEAAIPGVPERVAGLQRAGKTVMVVTNAAGYPQSHLLARYSRLGYDFASEDVVSSRATLLRALEREPARRWGIMASKRYGLEGIEHLNTVFLGDIAAEYDAVDGFLFIGSGEWHEAHHRLLEASLLRSPRPLLVGNPDIVAPVETGLSREPGFYAHRLADATGVVPQFFGKPFGNIYDLVFERLGGDIDKGRVLMVGDTLHTDVIGGQASGVRTALVSGYGFFAGSSAVAGIRASGISPDFILDRP